MARPKIRHLAILARNPKKMADYYTKVFDMEIIHQNAAGNAFFLSDGYITMAVLPHKLENDGSIGLNHFGFQVDDIAAMSRKIVAFDADIEEPKKRPADRPYAEFRGCDTEGNSFDLSEHGFERAESNAERDAKKAPVSAKEKALV
ncbi:MAG TPA: VOC family protein [Stellaceae bacterium]|nr:VOC family protein [Stellaceae bacterium]